VLAFPIGGARKPEPFDFKLEVTVLPTHFKMQVIVGLDHFNR
jgi:hypothetical protein